MDLKNVFEDYKKIFILCLEVAGEKTGDKLLLNVEKNLDDQLIYSIINELEKQKEIYMGELICIMLSTLLVPRVFGILPNKNIGINDLESFSEKIKKVSEDAADLYHKYLKVASEKFCESRGIVLNIDFRKMSKPKIQ